MAMDPSWRSSIESLIRETEENLHAAPGGGGGATPPPLGLGVLAPSTNYGGSAPHGGAPSKSDLRREVASIQNHVRTELDARLDEQRQEMEDYFRKELDKQATFMARQLSEIRREAQATQHTGADDGAASGLSMKTKVDNLEQAIDQQGNRDADIEDRAARDKQELRAEMRTAQSAVFTHVSDVETNLKRSLQQADSNIRELRGQVRESIRATKEQVDELEEQSNAVLMQLKRSVLEHQQATDEHNSASKRAESELQATVTKVRRLERLVGLLEEAVQDAASGAPMRPLSHYRAASEAAPAAPAGMSSEAMQRHMASALQTQMQHVEQQLSSLRDLTQNRIELESSRTTAACEQMLSRVTGQVSQERDARMQLERDLKSAGAQVDSVRSQAEQMQATIRRQLSDADSALAEEGKLREELESSMTAQLKMAALRLEEEVSVKVSTDIAQLSSQVAQLQNSGAAWRQPAAGAPPATRSGGGGASPAVLQSAVGRIEQMGSRLEAQEREQAAVKSQLRELGTLIEEVKEAGSAVDTFEERNNVINAKFRDMVAVCGNVVQEAERTQKELAGQRSEMERLRADFALMDGAMQNLSDGTQKAHMRMDSLGRQAPKGAVQGLEERMAILEAESTIRRQQNIMSGGARGGATSAAPDGAPSEDTDGSSTTHDSHESYENRITAQVRLLEQKLLSVLKEEDALIQTKVDDIREALAKESGERMELSSMLTSRMEERIRSLADVIDTATSEAVKEMSTLFEPEMQRLRGQFEASMETDSKMSALQEQVQKLSEGGGGAPSSQEASAVETEVGMLRHRMQSLEQDLQIMLHNSDSGQTAGYANAAVGGGSAGVDELRKTVEAKLAAFERAHKLQQQNREMLEEQVFAVRRSLPTIDRLASTIRESLESQQSAEQELLALKSTVEKQSGGGDALTSLAATVAKQGQDLAALSGSAETGSALDKRLRATETRIDKLDTNVSQAVRGMEGMRGEVMLEVRDATAASEGRATKQLQRLDDEVMRVSMAMDRQAHELLKASPRKAVQTASSPALSRRSNHTASSMSEASQSTSANSLIEMKQEAKRADKEKPAPIGSQILDEINKIEEKMAMQEKKTSSGVSAADPLASPMPVTIPPVGLGISVHETSELRNMSSDEPLSAAASAPAPVQRTVVVPEPAPLSPVPAGPEPGTGSSGSDTDILRSSYSTPNGGRDVLNQLEPEPEPEPEPAPYIYERSPAPAFEPEPEPEPAAPVAFSSGESSFSGLGVQAPAPEPVASSESPRKPPSSGGVLSSDTDSGGGGSGGGGGGMDWLEKLTGSIDSLEQVLSGSGDGDESATADGGGALGNALADDDASDDSFGETPSMANPGGAAAPAPAPVPVSAPAPAKPALAGFSASFSFLDDAESEDEAVTPTPSGAVSSTTPAAKSAAAAADFGDSFSFNSTASAMGAEEMLSPSKTKPDDEAAPVSPQPVKEGSPPKQMNQMRGIGSLPAMTKSSEAEAPAPGGAGVTKPGQSKPKPGGGSAAMPWASMGLGAGAAAAELEEDELDSFG